MNKNKLIVGVLGMPDNKDTPDSLASIASKGVNVDFVIYWKPPIKYQYKRFKRKLKNAGIIPTFKKVYYVLIKSKFHGAKSAKGYRQYFVSNHNSHECQEILIKEKVDVLILMTDAIITNKILKIPRLATLNAHPGWIPAFRGLGSNIVQLENGIFPAVSVHQVDEGIDTGSLIIREYLNINPKIGLRKIRYEIANLQHRLMAETLNMFKKGDVKFIDIFSEPSNITRGVSPKRRRKLDKILRSGKLKLSPPSCL